MALKVMFVDDEPDVLKVIRAMVEPLGFQVSTFADSQAASDRLKLEKFDGVFLDARMPHPNGFELAQTIRRSPLNSTVPVVLLTGATDAETMRKAFQAGITFFLGKPITSDRLIGMLKAMRGPMLKENRGHARLPFRAAVSCRSGVKSFKCESLNLSEGGILLETSGGTRLGDEIDLEFLVPPGRDHLKLRAKVVRNEPPDRVAVQFLALSPEDRVTIQNYIAGRIAG